MFAKNRQKNVQRVDKNKEEQSVFGSKCVQENSIECAQSVSTRVSTELEKGKNGRIPLW